MINRHAANRRWLAASAAAAALVPGPASAGASAARAPRILRTVRVTVDFGRDLGQHFGSLFEARDRSGRVVFGAGFPGVYNTMFRANRHTLQVYVRPPAGRAAPTAVRVLPRATPDSGCYLYDASGRIHTFPYTGERVVRAYDPGANAWREVPGPGGVRRAWGFADTQIGAALLRADRGHATCGGTDVLSGRAAAGCAHFYYALGHILCYRTSADGSATDVAAYRWQPGDAPVPAAGGVSLRVRYPGETPFAWGQFGGRALTCSNRGGIYAFDGTAWTTVQEPHATGSFQVYSMLAYFNRMLLAHYPSGELYTWDGRVLAHRPGWPPALPGVSTNAREAQTTAIYGGDLFVGVWPWGVVWRYDRDADRWTLVGRLFRTPALTDSVTHPYEAECIAAGATLNDWGQRVTGMVASGRSLMMSTASKGAWAAKDLPWMSAASRSEYGQIHELTEPGNLAADMQWTDRPTTFELRFTADRVAVWQDRRPMGDAPLPEGAAARIAAAVVAWGRGVHGPLAGRITAQKER